MPRAPSAPAARRIAAARPVAALAGALLTAGAAAAQAPACGPRAAIVEALRNAHGEEPAGAGLAGGRGVIEVFASPETGSWTLLLTLATGEACLIAAGEAWQPRPAPAPAPGPAPPPGPAPAPGAPV